MAVVWDSLNNSVELAFYTIMVQEKAVMKLPGICSVKQTCVLRVDCLSAACHGLIIGRTEGLN